MGVPPFGRGRSRLARPLLVGFLSAAAVASCASGGTASGGGSPVNGFSTVVLHATVSVTGGLSDSGTYDDILTARNCGDVAANGTQQSVENGKMFNVPVANAGGGTEGAIGGGHVFTTDVSANYTGPGSYPAGKLSGTQIRVDPPAGDEETHNFAPVAGLGGMTVNADGSGSYQFSGWQDPGSVVISGSVSWTCVLKEI
jgi:hypothetical protein